LIPLKDMLNRWHMYARTFHLVPAQNNPKDQVADDCQANDGQVHAEQEVSDVALVVFARIGTEDKAENANTLKYIKIYKYTKTIIQIFGKKTLTSSDDPGRPESTCKPRPTHSKRR
jgi:hypothetical protein